MGALSVQWERSSGDADTGYSELDDAVELPWDDRTELPAGAGRYYRCQLEAEGAVFLPPIDVRPLQQKLIPVVREMEEKGTWTKGLWDRIQAIQ